MAGQALWRAGSGGGPTGMAGLVVRAERIFGAKDFGRLCTQLSLQHLAVSCCRTRDESLVHSATKCSWMSIWAVIWTNSAQTSRALMFLVRGLHPRVLGSPAGPAPWLLCRQVEPCLSMLLQGACHACPLSSCCCLASHHWEAFQASNLS